MKKQQNTYYFAFVILLLVIANYKSAVAGAQNGIEICINVVLPSLFPLFTAANYLSPFLSQFSIPGIRVLGKRLGIPPGAEGIMILGLIGGYPVGARMIENSYQNRQINANTAKIMMGYCNNAGPGFILGIGSAIFSEPYIPLLLLLIHMASAVIVGFLLPKPREVRQTLLKISPITLPQSILQSMRSCATICGWIILFRAVHQAIFSKSTHSLIMVLLSGFLEMSSGCIQLKELSDPVMQFILCSVFIGFGGACVIAQTISVTTDFGLGLYIPGKLMQGLCSAMAAIIAAPVLFHRQLELSCIVLSAIMLFLILLIRLKVKNIWKKWIQ